jgi:hypothetical protein
MQSLEHTTKTVGRGQRLLMNSLWPSTARTRARKCRMSVETARLTVAGSTHDSKRLRNSFRNACRIFAACCLPTWPEPKLNSRNTARLLRSRRRDRLSELLGIGTCSADVRVVPGARIELATPAFSGRRSTGELPRHMVYLV